MLTPRKVKNTLVLQAGFAERKNIPSWPLLTTNCSLGAELLWEEGLRCGWAQNNSPNLEGVRRDPTPLPPALGHLVWAHTRAGGLHTLLPGPCKPPCQRFLHCKWDTTMFQKCHEEMAFSSYASDYRWKWGSALNDSTHQMSFSRKHFPSTDCQCLRLDKTQHSINVILLLVVIHISER